MNQTLSLHQLLRPGRDDATPIAWQDNHLLTLGHLRYDVAQLVPLLAAKACPRWAICVDNGYLFIVALLATLYGGKIPVLPGHRRPSLLREQLDHQDGLLTDGPPLEWDGPRITVTSSPVSGPATLPDLATDGYLELFTSGSTGQPKRVIKTLIALDRETALLGAIFGERVAGCHVVASVVPHHLYGLTFRILFPLSQGLPLQGETIQYTEQLTALDARRRYLFISSPAFLKRQDDRLGPPPVAMILSAGGSLSWEDAVHTRQAFGIWPDEIYGSTETGILAHRQRLDDRTPWRPFPDINIIPDGTHFRVHSPLIAAPDGLLLDDILRFSSPTAFHLAGRQDRIVKIEDKRISLDEVENRLLALDGIREAVAVPVLRGRRQGIGAVLVLAPQDEQRWRQGGAKRHEQHWRNRLRPWLDPLAIPRYWRVVDRIPVNSINKRNYRQLQELFNEAP